MLIVRFPDGDAEFFAGAKSPGVGDRIWRRGEPWVVARLGPDAGGHPTITVMPAEVPRDPSWPDPDGWALRS